MIGHHGSRNRTVRAGSLFERGVTPPRAPSPIPERGHEEWHRLLLWDELIYNWECTAISICHKSDILESQVCDDIWGGGTRGGVQALEALIDFC